MASADRRIHSRFPFTGRLEVRTQRGAPMASDREQTEATAPAIAVDVSVGGLGFRSTTPMAIGDLIRISLTDAERYSVDADGLGAEAPTSPRPSSTSGGISFEVEAVVRHVKLVGGDYIIGAERRPSA